MWSPCTYMYSGRFRPEPNLLEKMPVFFPAISLKMISQFVPIFLKTIMLHRQVQHTKKIWLVTIVLQHYQSSHVVFKLATLPLEPHTIPLSNGGCVCLHVVVLWQSMYAHSSIDHWCTCTWECTQTLSGYAMSTCREDAVFSTAVVIGDKISKAVSSAAHVHHTPLYNTQ